MRHAVSVDFQHHLVHETGVITGCGKKVVGFGQHLFLPDSAALVPPEVAQHRPLCLSCMYELQPPIAA